MGCVLPVISETYQVESGFVDKRSLDGLGSLRGSATSLISLTKAHFLQWTEQKNEY
jgi:hypothetical protein